MECRGKRGGDGVQREAGRVEEGVDGWTKQKGKIGREKGGKE